MQWPPNYKKIILQPGDEYAIHDGAKGGLQMGAMEIGNDIGLPGDLEKRFGQILDDLEF